MGWSSTRLWYWCWSSFFVGSVGVDVHIDGLWFSSMYLLLVVDTNDRLCQIK